MGIIPENVTTFLSNLLQTIWAIWLVIWEQLFVSLWHILTTGFQALVVWLTGLNTAMTVLVACALIVVALYIHKRMRIYFVRNSAWISRLTDIALFASILLVAYLVYLSIGLF